MNTEQKPPEEEPIVVETHRDLGRNMRAICERINANPELARLVLVNAILAFEDAGVEMSQEVKSHIRKTLRRPAKLEERKARLEKEIRAEYGDLVGESLQQDACERARFLFETLGLECRREEDAEEVGLRRMRAYVDEHPLLPKLLEYQRAARGGFILHPRASYNQFKAGERRHRWVKAVRFKV